MNSRSVFAAGALALVAALPLRAQSPQDIRVAQLSALTVERTMILHMVDSIPTQYFREKATPTQRDFAQQLYHAATAVPMILSRIGGSPAPTGLPDTTVALGSKDGLRQYVNAAFDYAEGVLHNQTDADRMGVVNLFGTRVARWQLWDDLHQHTIWTLGQVVGNFRVHGMAPPAFMFF